MSRLRGAVLARGEGEERGRLIEKRGGDVARAEIGMVDDVFEERNVGLDAAHAEFAEGAVDALAGLSNSRAQAVILTSSES